jgi:hypothetical protein
MSAFAGEYACHILDTFSEARLEQLIQVAIGAKMSVDRQLTDDI